MTTDELKKLKSAYKFQKSYSKRRIDRNGDPISFELTFDEWLKIWIDSGHLENRGTFSGGYVMARKEDIGPYSKDNVEIILHSDNIKFAKSYWGGPSDEVRQQIKDARAKQVITEEAKKKMSESHTARWATIDRSTLNWTASEETRQKMSATRKGKPRPKVTCPHCGFTGGAGVTHRYHFDNCKSKP